MPDFSPAQIAILSRLNDRGFVLVAFPMYANYVGVRRGDCAALLAPDNAAGFRVFGEPSWLLAGTLSVKLSTGSGQFFVWKKTRVEATQGRLALLAEFTAALGAALDTAL